MMSQSRRRFLYDRYNDRIQSFAGYRNVIDRNTNRSYDWIPIFISCDSTQGKHTEWLINCYLDGQFDPFAKRDRELLHNTTKKIELYNAKFGGFNVTNRTVQNVVAVLSRLDLTSNKQKRKIQKNEGSQLIVQAGNNKAIHVLTYDACKLYSYNTKWCISDKQDYQYYADLGGMLYLITIDNAKYMICIFDIQTALTVVCRDELNELVDIKSLLHHDVVRQFFFHPLIIEVICRRQHCIIWYCKNILKGRWEEKEHLIIYPGMIYEYAAHVVNGRFTSQEHILLHHYTTTYTINYCCEIIGGRWLEYEDILLKSQNRIHIEQYISRVLSGTPVDKFINYVVLDTYTGSELQKLIHEKMNN